MYTLKLIEIDIEPKIVEDKVFEDDHEWSLMNTVSKYVVEHYPGVYPDESALTEKVRASIRDQNNQNHADRIAAYTEDFNKDIEAGINARKEGVSGSKNSSEVQKAPESAMENPTNLLASEQSMTPTTSIPMASVAPLQTNKTNWVVILFTIVLIFVIFYLMI